jgi:DNA-directed RNA polymerase subunit RPC12/RpoP
MDTSSTTKRKERKVRALNEVMYLIDLNSLENEWIFGVEGTRGIKYDIFINNEKMTCTCPYFVNHFKVCKHIYFVVGRVCKLDISKILDDFKLNIYDIYPDFSNIVNATVNKRTDTVQDPKVISDCCICYDEMLDSMQLYRCYRCNNHFHDSCITHWLSNSSRKNCPLCREKIIQNIKPVDIFNKFNNNLCIVDKNQEQDPPTQQD